MDIVSAISYAAAIPTLLIIAGLVHRERMEKETERRAALFRENLRLKNRLHGMETDAILACNAARTYDALVQAKTRQLRRELEYKDALLRQKWKDSRE